MNRVRVDLEDSHPANAKLLFNSTARGPGYPGYPERSGQMVEVIRRLGAGEAMSEEVGPMYRVRFADGVEADAFGDELVKGENQ